MTRRLTIEWGCSRTDRGTRSLENCTLNSNKQWMKKRRISTQHISETRSLDRKLLAASKHSNLKRGSLKTSNKWGTIFKAKCIAVKANLATNEKSFKRLGDTTLESTTTSDRPNEKLGPYRCENTSTKDFFT